MIETLVIGLIVIAGAGGRYVLARRRPASAPQRKKPAGRFGAAEIRTRTGACAAARALEGRRFLAKQAPALPLAECTAATCSCSFGKLTDRRTEDRRFEHGAIGNSLFMMANRRIKRERRMVRSQHR